MNYEQYVSTSKKKRSLGVDVTICHLLVICLLIFEEKNSKFVLEGLLRKFNANQDTWACISKIFLPYPNEPLG